MKEFAINILWCCAFMVTICVVAVSLLFLGAHLAEKSDQHREKVINCLPTGKGFYACKTEWLY